MLGDSDKSYFYFDDRCFFVLGIFFFLMCESLFLAFFFMGFQGVVVDVSER